MATINRSDYAAMFGPTTGDQVRLADTNLWAEIETDFAKIEIHRFGNDPGQNFSESHELLRLLV